MNLKNIDTSNLTPEQLAQAELMAKYTSSHECKAAFNIVNLAETILPHLVSLEHTPLTAFALAIKYAEHAQASGEMYMQQAFETWKAARPTEPAPAPEDVDFDDAPLVEAEEVTPAVEETITRDAAVADTQSRTAAGEAVKPFADTLPSADPAAVVNPDPHLDGSQASDGQP